jgi:hypothetical protein
MSDAGDDAGAENDVLEDESEDDDDDEDHDDEFHAGSEVDFRLTTKKGAKIQTGPKFYKIQNQNRSISF